MVVVLVRRSRQLTLSPTHGLTTARRTFHRSHRRSTSLYVRSEGLYCPATLPTTSIRMSIPARTFPVLSSHLFYGYQILEWAYAEPFKIIWAVRNDGTLLSLTFLKEQELIGWAHSDTTGLFKSVCSVTEQVSQGAVDAVYFVVQRTVNGNNTVQYIERMAEQYYPNGVSDAWCVDAGIGYNGSPATTFSGAQHLAGAEVTGLADGQVITPFTMPTDGNFTLRHSCLEGRCGPRVHTTAANSLDLGEPTVQGKRKTLRGIDLKVNQTLGLWLGRTFDTLVAMKDLVRGTLAASQYDHRPESLAMCERSSIRNGTQLANSVWSNHIQCRRRSRCDSRDSLEIQNEGVD